MNLRETIKQLRARTGLTQSKFAEKFSMPKHTLEQWEMGIRKPPVYVVKMIETILDLEEQVKEK